VREAAGHQDAAVLEIEPVIETAGVVEVLRPPQTQLLEAHPLAGSRQGGLRQLADGFGRRVEEIQRDAAVAGDSLAPLAVIQPGELDGEAHAVGKHARRLEQLAFD
jgi:hypothetical protein